MPESESGVTLARWTRRGSRWRRDRWARMKPSTQLRLRGILDRSLLPEFGRRPLSEITGADVEAWFERRSAVAPGGANRELDSLRAICRHAVAEGALAADPTRLVERNRSVRRTRFLSTAEIARLHEVLDGWRGRWSARQQVDVIRLLLLTGCRRSEIVRLRWSEVSVSPPARIDLEDSKTGPRTVWLCDEAAAVLDCVPRRTAWVFPDQRRRPDGRLRQGCRSGSLSAWRAIREAAGIGDVRLHDLRHTWASQAVMAGVPLPVVARSLGHASTRMTARYAHLADAWLQEAAERVGSALEAVLEVSACA